MRAVLERPVPVIETKSADGPQQRLLRGYLHKTSNGLCGIKGYASLIAERGEQSESAARWARKIIHEVERMEEIFRSVGDLSRPRSVPGLPVTLEEAISIAADTAEQRHPELTVRATPIPDGELLLPAADLGMILGELLDNAAEAGARRAWISGAVDDRNRVVLAVEDDGHGFEPELLRQAADPFVTTRSGQLGIGLARVETLLDMYGLGWSLDSEAGCGATVLIEVGRYHGWLPEMTDLKRKAGNG